MRCIRTREEIKKAVESWNETPLFFSDVMHTAYMVLCLFLDWEDIPPAYQKVLASGKDLDVVKNAWNSDSSGLTEVSIMDDIQDEVKYLRKIVDADDNPAFWRLPRLLGLLWVLGEDERLFKVDRAIVKTVKEHKISKKKTREFIKTLSDFV